MKRKPKYACIEQHYAIGKTLGEGTFGKVRKGKHKLSGVKVAVKELVKRRIVDEADVLRVSREIKILKTVQHSNLIKLYEVIDTPKYIFLIMEFVSGGELFDHIVKKQRLKETEACRFFHHIVNGIEYCHRKQIVHRDLKPENLLIDKQSGLKIVDFGLGNEIVDNRRLYTACGSPCYAAPEMIAGEAYVGYGVDVWSLGIILYALICGYLPFEDENTNNLYKKILLGHFTFPAWISENAKDLIRNILRTNPTQRYQIFDITSHPWYRQLSTHSDDELTRPIKKLTDCELNESIIKQLMMSGYERREILDSVVQRRHDPIFASYHLLEARAKRKENLRIKPANKPIFKTSNFIDSIQTKEIPRSREGRRPANRSARKRPPRPTTPLSHYPPSSQRPPNVARGRPVAFKSRRKVQHTNPRITPRNPKVPSLRIELAQKASAPKSARRLYAGSPLEFKHSYGQRYSTSARLWNPRSTRNPRNKSHLFSIQGIGRIPRPPNKPKSKSARKPSGRRKRRPSRHRRKKSFNC